MPSQAQSPSDARDAVVITGRFPSQGEELPDHELTAAAFFDRYQGDVNRLVWRLLGADSEHDDVVHDVFVQLLKGRAKVRDPAAMRGWVLAVTANTVRSTIRRRKLRRTFGLQTPSVHGDARLERFAGASDDLEGRQLLAAVYDILDGMSADLRNAFVLRHMEQLTLPEVAQACGCSLATAKRRLVKARDRFERAAARVDGLAERLNRAKAGASALGEDSP